MTPQERKVMELALDALERYQVKRQDFERFADVITDIKEALAQPKKPEQEPVAHLLMKDGKKESFWFDKKDAYDIDLSQGYEWVDLYTTPPQQELVCVCGAVWEGQELVSTPPQRKPLTDEEIWKFWWARPEVQDGEDDSMEAEFVAAVRAVLAAHGIKD